LSFCHDALNVLRVCRQVALMAKVPGIEGWFIGILVGLKNKKPQHLQGLWVISCIQGPQHA